MKHTLLALSFLLLIIGCKKQNENCGTITKKYSQTITVDGFTPRTTEVRPPPITVTHYYFITKDTIEVTNIMYYNYKVGDTYCK